VFDNSAVWEDVKKALQIIDEQALNQAFPPNKNTEP